MTSAKTSGARHADWAAVAAADAAYDIDRPRRLLALLATLRDDRCGFPIDRLEHSLQAATRALRDGQDDSYVVAALFHDVGAAIAPGDHGALAALLLRPYIDEETHWMLAHHDAFQLYHYGDRVGLDPHAREAFRDQPGFARTADFVARYDEPSFDPDYPSLPLAAFAAVVERVTARRAR